MGLSTDLAGGFFDGAFVLFRGCIGKVRMWFVMNVLGIDLGVAVVRIVGMVFLNIRSWQLCFCDGLIVDVMV